MPDNRAGEGPLNGLITALQAANRDLVVVLACDLLEPSAAAIRRVVEAASGTSAADGPVTVPVVAGRPQWLHGAWRRDPCLGPLLAAFDGGERSIHRATSALDVRFVDDPGPGFDDADTPEDLTDGG